MNKTVRSLFCLFLLLLPATPCLAGGTEFTLSGSDLVVDVSTRWIGGRDGGYYPVRLKIRNIGPPRRLELRFDSARSYQTLPDVVRRISIEQNQTLNTTLLVPLVSEGMTGNFRVMENGRQIKNLERVINVSEMTDQSVESLAMLVIHNTNVDAEMYNRAAALHGRHTSGGSGASSYSHFHYAGHQYLETIEPFQLPENWLAYTPVDFVAITPEDFEQRLDAEEREAILNWVETGGQLIFFNVGENPTESETLNRLINWNNRAFSGDDWHAAKPNRFRHINIPADPGVSSTTGPEDLSKGDAWPINGNTFHQRQLGLGMVHLFPEDPFPGTASHWTWFLKSLENQPASADWETRHGLSTRRPTTSFLKFLIPSVGQVPVIPFLLLITIFTVIIGPVNYGYFLRKKRLSMLLVTVPVLAIGSSLLLIGYSTIAHGFSTKSRVRSLTVLDQDQGSSVSVSRVAYYAGMAPSSGLKFAPTTAVYPIWATESTFESGRVNWSDVQHMETGWLRSRTRTQFLTISNREQRGRIQFTRKSDQSAELSNGLEWRLESIILMDQQGDLWYGRDIDPGAVAKLEPASSDALGSIRERLNDHELTLPDGITEQQAFRVVSNGSSYRSHYAGSSTRGDSYKNSQQEQILESFRIPDRYDRTLKPNSYFAILDENPDLDLGLERSSTQLSLHTLLGYY